MAPQSSAQTPLIGRADDLTHLTDLIGLGSPDPGDAAVLLSGDAGIGKTRLLIELRDAAQSAGWRVLVGHCLDVGDRALPYLPFSEVLGRLAAESPALAQSMVEAGPAIARLLPGRRLLSDDSEQAGQGPQRMDRAELLEAVLAGLRQLSRVAPVLLIVEDLHWADSSTREMLGFLFARRPLEGIAIVCSYRGEDLHRRHPLRAAAGEWGRLPGVTRLPLQRLGEADMRRLVRALHPAPLPEGALRGIIDRAEGNAFFAEELVAAAGRDDRVLPTDLADLLLVRLDHLDDAARRVLQVASVAGRRVTHDLLARVADLDDAALDRSLRAAVESNLLISAGTDGYAFRHALLAEAVFDDLLPGERVRLHGDYATALAKGGEGSAAELARHARAAHDIDTALRASITAGDEAMALGGPAEAAHHYELALELLPRAGIAEEVDVVALAVRASDAAAAAGHVLRAIALLRDQLGQLPDGAPPLDRATLLHALAGAAILVDTDLDVLQLTTEVLDLIPAEPPTALRARAMSLHARANAERGREDASTQWAEEALALGQRLGVSDVVADATTTLARHDQLTGDPESLRQALEQAVHQAREAGQSAAELRALFSVGSISYENGLLAQAREAYQAAADRARAMGRPWAPYGVDGRALAGIVAYVEGDWDGALAIVDASGESPPDVSAATLEAVAMGVAAGRGEFRAVDLVGGHSPRWLGDGMIAVLAGGAAIDLYGDAGDLDAAAAVHDEVVALVSRLWDQPDFQARLRFSALMLGQLGAAAQRSGPDDRVELARRGDAFAAVAVAIRDNEASRGRAFGPESEAWFARVGAEHARLRWLTGVSPPPLDELIAAWETAVAAFERFGHVFEVARSQARLAAVLRAASRAAEATEVAATARTTAQRLGAEPLLRELRTLGPAPAPRAVAGRVAAPALTPREEEVLALVALGRSNRAISQQLYISAKTVSVHVSNILSKLGAGGRTEAVALARHRGLLTLEADSALAGRGEPSPASLPHDHA